jgi:isopropylmalate/homocitrate/citramalate synthase
VDVAVPDGVVLVAGAFVVAVVRDTVVVVPDVVDVELLSEHEDEATVEVATAAANGDKWVVMPDTVGIAIVAATVVLDVVI